MFKMDKELSCVLGLSLCFMFLFAADFTMVNMQKIVVSSIADDRPGYSVEGYMVIAITYTFFSISVWFGPYTNQVLGPKVVMVLSALGYLFYITSYAIEDEWVIYLGAISVGIAAGTLWPAHGHYLINSSSPQTTSRNVGIFWFIFMSSSMLGNVFVYYTFYGKKYINRSTRRTAIYSLVAINTLAIFAFMLLPKIACERTEKAYGPIESIKKSVVVLTSRKMLWLTLTFCYAGLQQSFWNGIYSPSIGFTLAFGESAKELVALSGIFMSIGALLGSFCPIVFSHFIRRHCYARRLIVLSGCIAQLFSYLIAYVNLPDSAVFGNTEEESFIHPSAELAMLGSLLLNFGDSCLSTQIYSFIGDYYRETVAEACTLYKFVKGVLVAMSFFWCNHLGLHTQVAIMAVMAFVGVTAFFIADNDYISQSTENKKPNKEIQEEGIAVGTLRLKHQDKTTGYRTLY